MAMNQKNKSSVNKSKRRWLAKSFSVDKDDMSIFKRLAREAEQAKPKVSESSLLVQILKDYFLIKDEVNKVVYPGESVNYPGGSITYPNGKSI